MHDERRFGHFALTRQIQPNLEKSRRVFFIRMNQRKHLAVNHAFSRRHPLQVTFSVPTGVAQGIRVVDDTIQSRGDRFKPAMRVLGKARNFISVIHSVRCGWVEVRAVASSRRFHSAIARRILVFVVDAKEKRILRVHRAVGESVDADDDFVVTRCHGRRCGLCERFCARGDAPSAEEKGEFTRLCREHESNDVI